MISFEKYIIDMDTEDLYRKATMEEDSKHKTEHS